MELATSICSISTNNLPLYGYPRIQIGSFKYRPLFSPWRATCTATSPRSSFTNMVSNGYVGRGSSSFRYNTSANNSNSKKLYTIIDSCLVVPPPKGKNPRAIIKFLGGAFIGAVPEVTYGNGALLQVLTGSYFCDKIPKANVIISFNNRPATEAVPYFEQLGPLVNQMMPIMEANPMYSMARSASGDAWKMLTDTAGAIIPEIERDALTSLTKFVDQLPSVLNQVTEGVSEFKPKPSENRDCFRNSYNVQHTLLVKFSSDTIDETDLLEETLKPRVESMGGTIEKVQLSGNHITPCIQEPKWQVGYVYTPADAIAQVLKTLSLNETRVLSRTISNWFRRFED
ncbi:hypothetical protein MANES_03G055500v8 [Manihot esculenta]|uniref:Uncharacterized protein n=2 Tax=Manihot esculenta TaxID=3983 RepID=A0ACB7I077_MANES|nr:hypothetical protein MANES_03G055500v8 [Manihot esculenta]KAG8657259.1 hypothetical protein MANES_03G055500v8 [Manihot esculenta]